MHTNKLLSDGLLAGTSCFVASDVMAQGVANNTHEANPFLQVLIPVITGVVVPFLKEWTLTMAKRRRERKAIRKELKATENVAP